MPDVLAASSSLRRRPLPSPTSSSVSPAAVAANQHRRRRRRRCNSFDASQDSTKSSSDDGNARSPLPPQVPAHFPLHNRLPFQRSMSALSPETTTTSCSSGSSSGSRRINHTRSLFQSLIYPTSASSINPVAPLSAAGAKGPVGPHHRHYHQQHLHHHHHLSPFPHSTLASPGDNSASASTTPTSSNSRLPRATMSASAAVPFSQAPPQQALRRNVSSINPPAPTAAAAAATVSSYPQRHSPLMMPSQMINPAAAAVSAGV